MSDRGPGAVSKTSPRLGKERSQWISLITPPRGLSAELYHLICQPDWGSCSKLTACFTAQFNFYKSKHCPSHLPRPELTFDAKSGHVNNNQGKPFSCSSYLTSKISVAVMNFCSRNTPDPGHWKREEKIRVKSFVLKST